MRSLPSELQAIWLVPINCPYWMIVGLISQVAADVVRLPVV